MLTLVQVQTTVHEICTQHDQIDEQQHKLYNVSLVPRPSIT